MPSAYVTSSRSVGPSPRSARIASSVSRTLPQARPNGRSMAVMSATVGQPRSSPSAIIVFASSSPRSTSGKNAPLPFFTSSTRPFSPSASFFDMMLAEIRGIDSTVAVTSRSAYSLRSAGAISAVGPMSAQPSFCTCAFASASERLVRKPGIASSLSSVPPVWPSPRPDIIGTATPQAATRGPSTRETLSPTPPVECLSMRRVDHPSNERRCPDASIASVSAANSWRSSPRRKTAISNAAI